MVTGELNLTSDPDGGIGAELGSKNEKDLDPGVRTISMTGKNYPSKPCKPRIAVLASGRGSDLQAIIDAVDEGRVSYEVSLVICNNPEAFAIERAKKHSIPYVILDHRGKEREKFDLEMHDILKEMKIDLVVLAGFMRILSNKFVQLWKDKIINIHPALLPSFPGAHAHRDAIEYGVKISGLTIHFVDEKMDSGPIIFQYPVEVKEGDDEESLSMRILEKEHEWYPIIIDRIVNGNVSVIGRNVTLGED